MFNRRAIRISLIIFAIGIAAAAVAIPAFARKPQKLHGSVGVNEAYVITLKNSRGGTVRRIKRGRYLIRINDASRLHDFHLTGPGVDKDTGVASTGKVTWNIRLRPGKYTYECEPHDTTMIRTFRVV